MCGIVKTTVTVALEHDITSSVRLPESGRPNGWPWYLHEVVILCKSLVQRHVRHQMKNGSLVSGYMRVGPTNQYLLRCGKPYARRL